MGPPAPDAPSDTRGTRASVACRTESKKSRPVSAWENRGTVVNTASATKAKVPSLPMMRWVRTSIGRWWSRKAFTPYPIVFFIANSRSTVATARGSDSSR